jgi:hypothetical protein
MLRHISRAFAPRAPAPAADWQALHQFGRSLVTLESARGSDDSGQRLEKPMSACVPIPALALPAGRGSEAIMSLVVRDTRCALLA